MDAEAQGSASDTSGNPEVAWWCKILTRLIASIAGVGELAHPVIQRRCLTWKTVTVTVTVTINGLVKLSAFNAHICPSKYLASF